MIKPLIGICITMLSIITAVFYFQNNKIESLTNSLHAQEQLTESYLQTSKELSEQVSYLDKEMDDYISIVNEVNSKFEVYRNEVSKLEKTFSKNDFTALTKAKPITIEKIINKGTDEVFQQIELETDWTERVGGE